MLGSPKCLYYAFGGGLGHGTRAMALARKLARVVGGEHYILLNSPFAATLRQEITREPRLQTQELSPLATKVQAAEFVRQAIESYRPDALIVDTFPRGLGGELIPVLSHWKRGRRVLIGRTLPAVYVQSYQLDLFISRHYDQLIAPGEASPYAPSLPVHATKAFLIRDFDELPSVAEAVRLTKTALDERVILVVASGTDHECRETMSLAMRLLRRAEGRVSVRLGLPEEIGNGPGGDSLRIIRHFPLIECLPAIRVVIGAGGYNLMHEVQALQVPTFARPRQRTYDCQTSRIDKVHRFSDLEDLWPRLVEEMEAPYQGIQAYENGAAEAARKIAASL